MSGPQGARTVRYSGQDRDEAGRAFASDSERAIAAGYVVTGSRWDASAPQPTLVVDYAQASGDRALRPGPAAAPSGRRGGLGEALLLVGIILAGIIGLAVAIPAPAPTATPIPSTTQAPASSAPASTSAGG
jgi:hypothetical protein